MQTKTKKETIAVIEVSKEFLCYTTVSEEDDFKVYMMPDVQSGKYVLRECNAKKVADEINSLFGDKDPASIGTFVIHNEFFKQIVQSLRSYKMKDDSILVWCEDWAGWGFIYPPEYVYFVEDKN